MWIPGFVCNCLVWPIEGITTCNTQVKNELSTNKEREFDSQCRLLSEQRASTKTLVQLRNWK